MGALTATIANYYPRIDRQDVEWVLALFSPHAVYHRADATYEGIDAIRRFFSEDRKIRGEHVLNGLWTAEDGRTVIATGEFVGEGAAGDPRRVGFADVWEFDSDGQVTHRRTFLALGQDYVKA